MSADGSVVGKALATACADVREGETSDAIAGVTPAFVASPGSNDEAAALMRAAAEHDLAVVPRGGGSRLGWGVPPSRCDLLVDMTRMNAVTEHASGDLVARVQAGARMGDVAGVLATAGQEIALDVPSGATAGVVVASGLAGPRRLRYGSPRDLLIGITVVRADGTLARSGGKVVKNVAGYDLGKLFAGSAGTLGLITEVTFRLHPLPAARAFVTAASIFMRLRIIEGSLTSFCIRARVNRATFCGSNPLNARLYPSRFLSTIDQLRPVWAASRTRNSKCVRSSWTGAPHSRSW